MTMFTSQRPAPIVEMLGKPHATIDLSTDAKSGSKKQSTDQSMLFHQRTNSIPCGLNKASAKSGKMSSHH